MAGKVMVGGASAPTRGRGRRTVTSLAEINVVPLVDVMLVLLIIFMVTAPMIQRGVDVKMPTSRRAESIDGERIFVTIPSTFKADGMVFMNADRMTAIVMQERVRQKMERASDKQVYLRGDQVVQLQELMTIIDRLKDAGVVNIGILAKAPGEL